MQTTSKRFFFSFTDHAVANPAADSAAHFQATAATLLKKINQSITVILSSSRLHTEFYMFVHVLKLIFVVLFPAHTHQIAYWSKIWGTMSFPRTLEL